MQDSIGTEFVGIYRDMGLAIASEAIGGHKYVHKFGRNDILAAAWADIWPTGGVFVWPQTSGVVSVVSSSANDTATGSGLRNVIVSGLLDGFTEASETITLDGANTVSGTTAFRRVHRMYAGDCGTYAGTTITGHGSITATHVGNSCISLHSNTVTYGQSQVARYTVPAGYTAYWLSMDITVDSTKSAQIAFWQRRNAGDTSAPFTSKRLVRSWDGLSGVFNLTHKIPQPFPEKTDLWFSGLGSAAASKATVEFDLILVENT